MQQYTASRKNILGKKLKVNYTFLSSPNSTSLSKRFKLSNVRVNCK